MTAVTPPQHPMQFDREDFWRGSVCAWGTFMSLLLIVPPVIAAVQDPESVLDVWVLMYLGYAGVIGGIVSGVAVLCFATPVWWVAQRLRGVRAIGVHVAVYACLGGGIGLAMALLLGLYYFGATPAEVLANPWAWALAAASAVSVVAGWGHAAHRAHRTHRTTPGRAADRRTLDGG